MTICPFMSRPVVGLHDTKLHPVDCQREKCEAWKMIGGTRSHPQYGCRFIGGEVPE